MSTKVKASFVLALCVALLPTLAAAHITDRAEILGGHVVLTRIDKLDVVVTIDNLPAGGDGIADQAFIYRSRIALPDAVSDFSGESLVIVSPDMITIKGANGTLVSLGVRTDNETGVEVPGPRFDPRSFKATGRVVIDSGYQLSRLFGQRGVSLVDSIARELQLGPNWGFKCVSGGPGSTDCSIEGSIAGGGAGCSVSCASGYYACCSLSGCHCTKGGEEEELAF